MTELCRQHGVSPKTGYKWVQRYHDGGLPNLMDRSRAPHSRPYALRDEIVEAVVALRRKRPTWGPRKLKASLEREKPKLAWPAPSTIGEILSRHGLIEPRKRRQRTPVSTHPLALASAPNDIWCVDYKGKFRIERRYCHPFTMTDARTRFVLACTDTGSESYEPTRTVCEWAFREYGLPLRIRSDNGSPFATRAVGGLSQLSVWWVKLGILPERIDPGKPQQNGRHERMHGTLKLEAVTTGSKAEVQQKAFDEWRADFNQSRPHEALENRVPADVYRPSSRPYPAAVGDPDYPDTLEIRRVTNTGCIGIVNQQLNVGRVLRREAVGVEQIDDGRYQLWFGPIYLGLVTDLGRGRTHFDRSSPTK